ncbi:MAG TPA: hypothetical protein VFJ19_08960 [Nocardioidaceae bacterium]|nr:hypothetical protein [Nocardioidaceae bacterium]
MTRYLSHTPPPEADTADEQAAYYEAMEERDEPACPECGRQASCRCGVPR